ncbi:rho family-interacting cell polarization regulator 1 isoform X2 [Amia ocellicauda]|nr:RIPR1 regulator [Amia calva]
MSLSVRPTRRVLSRSITRSQSFAGVNSTHDKPYRNLSVFSTPACSRRTVSRSSRMFTLSAKSPPPKVPQPERLDEVYEALKRGLQAYLQVHQLELDSLSRQMRESKRNSRLGFLYELDKQVKAIERFMRRLEFHLSKIDEMYEAYCMQRRLRDGANKMVKAYTASPGSREARESLSEANKGYKEYTESMCMLESELENLLGEFHVKMKGLAGFARLCAGDQYEIFMKYGRQRWKLRGRIEINGKQVWDSEDMVFLPLITEFLSIKVTELKSLANHVVVGNVSCETKDLFAALPQTVAVDINDLGTIKLSLEVTWNPFDKDDQTSSASTVNKASSVNKRFSTYNQSPPDTPSLREQAFYNMLRRQEEMENGTAWSNSSESSDDSSSPQLSLGLRHAQKTVVQPELQAAVPPIEISFASREGATPAGLPKQEDSEAQEAEEEEGQGLGKKVVSNGRYSRSLSHISEASADGAVTDHRGPDSPSCELARSLDVVSVNDIVMELPISPEPQATMTVACEPEELPGPADLAPILATPLIVEEQAETGVALDHMARPLTLLAEVQPESAEQIEPLVVAEGETEGHVTAPRTEAPQRQEDLKAERQDEPLEAEPGQPAKPAEAADMVSPGAAHVGAEMAVNAAMTRAEESMAEESMHAVKPRPVDSGVEEALNAVISSLEDCRGQFQDLQLLEQHVRQLEEVLMQGQGRSRSRSSSVSLTVETALESFNFLNTSDLEDDGSDSSLSTEHRDSVSLSTPLRPAEDSVELQGCMRCGSSPLPMSTGCEALDQALVTHLQTCSAQLLRLGTFGPLRCGEMYALDRLQREAHVLELVCRVSEDGPGRVNEPEEVVPQLESCHSALVFWKQCTGHGNVYTTSVDNFLHTLGMTFRAALPERCSSLADTVFVRLTERVLERKLPRRVTSGARELLTIFQFWNYLEAEGVTVLDTHIAELAEEVWLVHSLQTGDQDTLLKALRRPPQASLGREGLRAVSLLLRDSRGKVCSSAAGLLRGLAEQPRHRERALVSCLELLEDDSTETRVAGCKALACLKAKESIDQLVYLCQTDKDDVRDAAKQALLTFGEEGKLAIRHVEESQDGVPRLFAPGSMASTAF